MSAWPDVVWSADILRDVDARGRAEIAAAGALTRVRTFAPIFSPGQAADALYVVAEGAVAVRAVRRGEVASSVLRQATRGDVFGEEAMLAIGATRRSEARPEVPSLLAVIQGHTLRRVLARADGHDGATRALHAVRRAVARDRLRTMSFAHALSERDLGRLVDVIEHVELARGATLFREGDASTHAYLVASGMLQLQTEDLGRIHLRAYVAEGDFVGDEELDTGAPRRHTAVASGAAWIFAVPRAVVLDLMKRHRPAFDDARRVRVRQQALAIQLADGAKTTQHVFRDLYRLHVARSLLVIDQDACVRCGHCAWSCGASHDDGVSRLVRRGDKMLTGASDDATPLLVPNSCQHCENPSCMPDCPTGAIGRDLRGEVFIREDLCTGCGNCAKGCPWGNIQLAPRGEGQVARSRAALSPEVAVKCDLCRGVDGGPACVSACPTEAMARIDPRAALVELRALRGKAGAESPVPKAASMAPWAFLGLALAALLSRGSPRAPFASGAIAGLLLVALASYAIAKRWPVKWRAWAPHSAKRVGLRPWLIAHVTLGGAAIGSTFAHAGMHFAADAAGALNVAMLGALATGAFGALAYRVLPARLTRIERGGVLPEELDERARALDERVFAELTGKSPLLKTVYARILRPYATAPWGPLALLAGGRTLRAEERVVRDRVERAMNRSIDGLDGAEDLVRGVVDRRAIVAQRVVQGILRGWLPLHVALSAITVALFVAHVAIVVVYR